MTDSFFWAWLISLAINLYFLFMDFANEKLWTAALQKLESQEAEITALKAEISKLEDQLEGREYRG